MSDPHASNRQRTFSRPKQSGMTLVEIMISLLIGAILLGGVLQIFISTKQTYRMQEGLSRLQENARFAMEFLTFDIRMAGYQGCPSINTLSPNIIASPAPTYLVGNQFVAVNGANNVATNWSTNACGTANECLAGTDTISIMLGENCGGQLTGQMTSVNANIQIDAANTCNISAGDAVLISDCKSADLFRATTASSGSGKQTISHSSSNNTSNFLSIAYQQDAEIFGLRATTYYLRTGAGGQPALWRFDNNRPVVAGTNPIELVEGIDDMQITYGLDTDADGNADRYISADLVTNWNNAVSVRITVSARTLDRNLTTTGDGRLRRTMTTTVALRNKLR
ncbi:PilW family protein [Methylicorpusculum sp.]|uniref:PilW family protein n=1 Tax=Methylicorpusculum sp. TaxID=2713644 RepID=UPI002728426B|nr:PilW family protein [Methylicorpusculum sp.]MDO8845065.1 PilW family protein [Methylicorpusculum sp.]